MKLKTLKEKTIEEYSLIKDYQIFPDGNMDIKFTRYMETDEDYKQFNEFYDFIIENRSRR